MTVLYINIVFGIIRTVHKLVFFIIKNLKKLRTFNGKKILQFLRTFNDFGFVNTKA